MIIEWRPGDKHVPLVLSPAEVEEARKKMLILKEEYIKNKKKLTR